MLKRFFSIALALLTLCGCYNAVQMRDSSGNRDTCQADSDCLYGYVCVRNISPDSALGECIHLSDYDPWANRQLEDIIKMRNKKKLEKQDQL